MAIDLGNRISPSLNQKALAIQQWLLANSFEGLRDCFVAYSSVTLLYDPVIIKKQQRPTATVFEWVAARLQEAFDHSTVMEEEQRPVTRIPVCYDPPYAMDLELLAAQKQLSTNEVIDKHLSRVYRVYMIGFLPGFSYMAEVDEQLVVPRKPQPVPVQAGSVGITGAQTGIYPVNCPGGWYIIGRTPVKLFDATAKQPVLLRAGDQVQFYRITKSAFE
jgi:inhibitor of KinA